MSDADDTPQNLEALLLELEESCDGEESVTVGEIHEAIGTRSFGPLLLVCGVTGVTPLGAIPGAPTTLAVVIILVAGQLVIGREHFWIPKVIRDRKVKCETVRKSVKVATPPARWVDRLIKPRLRGLTGSAATRMVAVVCVLIAVAVPPLELLPFAAALPALAVTAFGLGLTAKDGVLVAFALALSAVAIALMGVKLFGG